MTNTDNLDGSAAPLMAHLKELRNRIMISIGAFIVAFILAFLICHEGIKLKEGL